MIFIFGMILEFGMHTFGPFHMIQSLCTVEILVVYLCKVTRSLMEISVCARRLVLHQAKY